MSKPAWYQILGCPREKERPPLTPETCDDGSEWLVCKVCKHAYRVENGIPNLLAENAISPEEFAQRQAGPKKEDLSG